LAKIGLIPLDDRPVNTRYPVMIGAIGGLEVEVPPVELLSRYRQPAPVHVLINWIDHHMHTWDALIVSVEMLGYGGLIPSRTSHDTLAQINGRLDNLREWHARGLPIYAFNVITRISRHNDNTEEADYWAEYGNRLFRLSQWMHRLTAGEPVGHEVSALRAEIPEALINDFLQRRGRNHQVNRYALTLLRERVIHRLAITSDDTSEWGLASSEKTLLQRIAGRHGLGEPDLMMYPGADEVASVLIARYLNLQANSTPRFAPRYLVESGREIIAPFEDMPIHHTVQRQIVAAGGEIAQANQHADVQLIINPPIAPDAEWSRPYTAAENAVRLPEMRESLTNQSLLGLNVAVADVAFANGADSALIALLEQELPYHVLCAFAAWNTAGNTIGTVIAQACAALLAGDHGKTISAQFLAHRLIEDWGYQTVVRAQVRDWLQATTGKRDCTADNAAETAAQIELLLNQLMAAYPSLGWKIAAGSVRLPWNRTFEIDFDLVPV
jgi:hypothetical protein